MTARRMVGWSLVMSAVVSACTSASAPKQNVATDRAAALAAVLKPSDLPSGWTAKPHSRPAGGTGSDDALAKCLGVPLSDLNTQGPASVNSPDFTDAANRSIANSVTYGATSPLTRRRFNELAGPRASGCLASALGAYLQAQLTHPSNPSATGPPGVSLGNPSAAKIPFAVAGDQTIAYEVAFPIVTAGASIKVLLDLVIAIKGRASVEMNFTTVGAPFAPDQEQKYFKAVVGRLAST